MTTITQWQSTLNTMPACYNFELIVIASCLKNMIWRKRMLNYGRFFLLYYYFKWTLSSYDRIFNFLSVHQYIFHSFIIQLTLWISYYIPDFSSSCIFFWGCPKLQMKITTFKITKNWFLEKHHKELLKLLDLLIFYLL